MTMNKTAPTARHDIRAFTLTELLIAMALMGFVVVGAASFTIQSLKIYYTDADRLGTNHDMRKFTQMMSTDTASANFAYIYDIATNGAIPTTGTDNHVTAGKSGDYLALITQTSDQSTITQIVVYWRIVPAGTTTSVPGAVYRFATPNTLTEPATQTIGFLLNKYGFLTAPTSTAGLFMGTMTGGTLATGTGVIGTATNVPTVTPPVHPNLFYNFQGEAIMVKAQIEEQGNQNQQLSVDTYNLTIWPRG
jgi:prepilin-type N-terminal cleavage/methylation domain-containing protein